MRLHPRFGLTLALAAIAALLLTAVPLLAQVDVTTGRISGQVVDETGAALPGASVEAKNKDTGLALVAVSDSRGVYRIVSVPVGTYAVTASLQGFGKQTDARVVITLGSAPTVDFKLRLSSKAESVTVTATEAVIETTQTSSQTTIDNNAIRSLPINGRNFTDFVLLAPNAQRETQRGNIAIGGQRGINTSVTLDGVDYNDAFFGGSSGDGSAEGRAPFTVSQESVREFQVIQNGASVEFGRSGGGFVNVVTKSGSNDFHGSAFYYNRPQATTAKFANGTDPRDQKTQQFGASIGGPILKDRLFFFGAWDQQIQSTTVPITSALVTDPDIAARYPKLGQTDPSYIQEQNGKVFFGRLDFQLTD
jgi:Carboxypeptidase regulatory-like domain